MANVSHPSKYASELTIMSHGVRPRHFSSYCLPHLHNHVFGTEKLTSTESTDSTDGIHAAYLCQLTVHVSVLHSSSRYTTLAIKQGLGVKVVPVL